MPARAILGSTILSSLLSILLAGCHDLPDLGTCGNGIIEATNGEACDGDEGGNDTCNDRCELTCQSAAVTDAYVVVGSDASSDEQYCPDARMTCALDGVCRAGGGQFSAPDETQDFNVRATAVGDFDGDLIDDLIGSTATSVLVRFGTDRGGALAASYSQPAPAALAPPAFFDRDPRTQASGASQLTMAIPNNGVALLTSNTESFLADLDPSIVLPNFASTMPVIVEDPLRVGGTPTLGDTPYEITRTGTAGVTVRRLPVFDTISTPPTLAACGTGASTLIDAAVSTDRRTLVVVVKLTGTSFDVCRYFHGATDTVWSVDVTHLAGAVPDGVQLANLGADPCPELVLTAHAMNMTAISFLPAVAGTCAFTTARALLTPVLPAQVAVFGAGDVRPGLGADELVTSQGVFAVQGGASLQFVIGPTASDRLWQAAAVGDLDRDGVLDVVAGRLGQDDVDVVRGGTSPNAYRADTDAEVTAVIAADVDGDGVGDAALVERSGTRQRLSIVYGLPSGAVGPAVPMVPFSDQGLRIASVRTAGWAPSPRTRDGVEDLIVVAFGANGTNAEAGVMFGEASRRLTMPRFPADLQQIGSIRGALVAGDLAGTAGAQIGVLSNGDATASVGKSLLINDVATAGWNLVDLAGLSAEIDLARSPALLRTTGAPWIVFGTMPGLAATSMTGRTCAAPAALPAAVRLRGADVIGDDGIDELVATSQGTQGLVVHVYPVTATGTSCAFGAEWPGLDRCADIARVGHQLVALCSADAETAGATARWGLYRVAESGERDAQPFAAVDGVGIQLATGDFDGDGVPDLAVSVARGGVVGVQLVHQCPAHDERGCQ